MSTVVRDLDHDLEICQAAEPAPWSAKPCTCGHCDQLFLSIAHSDGRLDPNDAQFVTEARAGWPHAILRAKTAEEQLIAADDKIDRLQHELRMLQDVLNQR